MENKKRFSVLKALIIIISILFIAVSVVVNISFSKKKTPNIMGRYIYLVKDDSLGDTVQVGSALVAKDATNVTLAKGDVVLCYPANNPSELSLRSVYDIVTAESGETRYYTANASGPDMTDSIGKEQVKAICTGYPENLMLGKFIAFTLSIKGILLELVLPCIIIVVFIILKIASSINDDSEEDYGFYEYDEEGKEKDSKVKSHAKSSTPLFEPSQEIQPSDELERKKMSIAENFSQKKVNPDSPYQKEKERTMQFKAQRSAESSFAARNMGGQSSTAPTADALREEMLRKTAEAERNAALSTTSYGENSLSEPVSDNTGVLSKAQLAEMARSEVPKTTPLKSPTAAVPKKNDSPDISDIITKTDTTARKKNADNMSVDDLLKMIENEKKKL